MVNSMKRNKIVYLISAIGLMLSSVNVFPEAVMYGRGGVGPRVVPEAAIVNGRGGPVYYTPGFHHNFQGSPHMYGYPPYYPQSTTVIYPQADINSCPLRPSYYDSAGNWIPPTRVCATPASQY
jgi:hypothetical protein